MMRNLYSTHMTCLFSGHAQLDIVNAELDVLANNFSHFIWPVCEGSDATHQLTVSSRHLLPISQIPRPRYVSSIDSISDYDI